MKKLIVVVMLMFMAVPALAVDRVGQDKFIVYGDVLTEFYYEIAGFTSQPQKLVDSTFALNVFNSSARDIAHFFRSVERDTVIDLVQDQEVYALPSDFDGVLSVEAYDDDGFKIGMVPISREEFGQHRDDTGIPQFYRLDKFQLKITPVHTTADSVILTYYARSNILSATTDTLNLNSEYSTLLVLMAAEKALRGKVPLIGPVMQAKLADVTARREMEQRLLAMENKGLMEILTK